MSVACLPGSVPSPVRVVPTDNQSHGILCHHRYCSYQGTHVCMYAGTQVVTAIPEGQENVATRGFIVTDHCTDIPKMPSGWLRGSTIRSPGASSQIQLVDIAAITCQKARGGDGSRARSSLLGGHLTSSSSTRSYALDASGIVRLVITSFSPPSCFGPRFVFVEVYHLPCVSYILNRCPLHLVLIIIHFLEQSSPACLLFVTVFHRLLEFKLVPVYLSHIYILLVFLFCL